MSGLCSACHSLVSAALIFLWVQKDTQGWQSCDIFILTTAVVVATTQTPCTYKPFNSTARPDVDVDVYKVGADVGGVAVVPEAASAAGASMAVKGAGNFKHKLSWVLHTHHKCL